MVPTQVRDLVHLDVHPVLSDRTHIQLHSDDMFEGQRASSATKVPDGIVSVISMGDLTLATSETSGLRRFLEKDDVESNLQSIDR